MPFLLLVTLALTQGVTEFLPISSSAHLVLTRWLWLGQADASAGALALDVALHVGTLAAVMLYFRQDVAALVRGGFGLLRGRRDAPARLAWLTLVATAPAIVAGLLAKGLIEQYLRGVEVIGWTTLVFGLLLGLADRTRADGKVAALGWRAALAIGAAQALALVPGVSRSGVAMTAGRFLGLARDEAARFALLLALPTIAGAGALAAYDLSGETAAAIGQDALIGAGLSFLAAYAAIWLMMRWLKRASFLPFVLYRVALGLALLAIVYF